MALKSISVRGYRNLKPAVLEFGPDSNYLFGPNGAGKTNLLEAIHYLAIGRSFRHCPDGELLGFDADVLVVSGEDDDGRTAEVRFDRREKRLSLAGTRVERLSEYLGWLPVVILLLEDIELVRGGPGQRRGFLDMAIAKTDRSYIGAVAEYGRVLLQRNRLLEKAARGERSSVAEQLAVWDDELVKTAVPVYERRLARVGTLLAAAGDYYQRLAGEPAHFSYWSSTGRLDDVPGALRAGLAATRERSFMLRHTLVGPHRDDIRIRRGERDLRRFGSVGEQRLAGIALRLAEADMILSSGRQRPVFLLDEVASELDERRAAMVFDLVRERGQMVYAAARRIPPQQARGQSAGGKVKSADMGQAAEGSSGGDPTACRDAGASPEHPWAKEFGVDAGTVQKVS